MPDNPFFTAIIDSQRVNKTPFRNAMLQTSLVVDTVAALRLLNSRGQLAVIINGNVYEYDSTSTAADDGVNCIHDSTGRRFILQSGAAFSSASFSNRAALQAASISTSVQIIDVRGHTTEGVGRASYKRLSAAPAPVKPWHVQSGDGAWWMADGNQPFGPLQLGAIRNGTTDESAAWNDSWEFVRLHGTQWIAGRGTAMLTNQVTFFLVDSSHLDSTVFRSVVADFSGCKIRTQGAISGFKIFGSQWQNPVKFINPLIDHAGNSEALCGIDIAGSSGWILDNPVVRFNANKVRTKGPNDNVGDEGYACVRIRESVAGIDPTFAGQPAPLGGYYNAIYEPKFIDETNARGSAGIHFKGQVNQVNIYGGQLRNNDVSVLFSDDTDVGDFVNSVNFFGTSFEDVNKTVKCEITLAASGTCPVGINFIGCRYEFIDVKCDFGNATSYGPQGGISWTNSNHIGPFTAGEYVNGTISLMPNNFFGGTTSGGFYQRGFYQALKSFAMRCVSSTEHGLEVWANISKGIAFRYADDSFPLAGWLGLRSGGQQGLRLQSEINGGLQVAGVQSLSSISAREGRNFRGQFTIPASATSVAVVFATAEPDTDYNIIATPVSSSGSPPDGSFIFSGVSSKSVGGFTANVRAATGAGSVTYEYVVVS